MPSPTRTQRPDSLVRVVGELSLALAFVVYFLVTFVPDEAYKRTPLCCGLFLVWAGSVLIAGTEPPHPQHRLGCTVVLAGMLGALAVMIW